MGVENFYIKVSNNHLKDIEKIFKKYDNCLDYSYDDYYCCVSGALVSFFPAVELIYNICSTIKERPFSIFSREQEICFNFETYLDFLNCMFKIWNDKLVYFNRKWGAFIVKPSSYYKTRGKLKKKYYKTF